MIIPLKKYINNWLDTYKIRDIFNNKVELARHVFRLDKSYILSVLLREKYYIDTDNGFVTQDKNYIKIIKKPLSQISPKRVKKFRVIGTKKVIDRYVTETIYDYVPVTKIKYRMIDDYDNPKYDTVIKRRKIKGKYYLTTEYIFTGKYHKKREYFEDIHWVRKKVVKQRPIYKTIDILEPYYEQIRERTENDYKTEVTEHRFYEPFFVFDYYKIIDDDNYEHYIYISPFFDGFGSAVKIGSDEDEIVGSRRLPKFISPQELIKTQSYNSAYRQCRFIIEKGKERLFRKYFKEINDRINNDEELHTVNILDSNKYSLDLLKTNKSGIFFFKSASLDNNTRKTII